MQKRGQLSVFIVVGIVVLAAIILVFFFKDKLTKSIRETPTNPQEYLDQQLNDIKNEIGRCINKETSDASELLMANGGVFNRSFNYIGYHGVHYPILCREIEKTGTCLSEPVLISNLQYNLDNYLPDRINKCMNLDDFKNKDYNFSIGNMNLQTTIISDNILVDVKMYVKLTKGPYTSENNKFVYSLDIPLGSLTNVANDLIQVGAGGNEIVTNITLYNLIHFNKYFIDVRRPYPDEVYDISLTTNNKYHFYFAFEGVGRYPRPEGRIR